MKINITVLSLVVIYITYDSIPVAWLRLPPATVDRSAETLLDLLLPIYEYLPEAALL